MEIINTKDRHKVEQLRKFSMKLVSTGAAIETRNWDSKSTWHNSKFTNTETSQEWVIYLPDHSWSGEVKVL
jgi:hypothetical protein